MAIVRVTTKPGHDPLIITDYGHSLFVDIINDPVAMEAIVDVMIETMKRHPELLLK